MSVESQIPVDPREPLIFEFEGKRYLPSNEFQSRCQGIWPSMGSQGVWSVMLWERAVTTKLTIPMTVFPVIGVDSAGFGSDYTAIVVRWGPCAMHHEEWNGWDHHQIARRIDKLVKHWAGKASERQQVQAAPVKLHQIRINIDADAIGNVVLTELSKLGLSVTAIGAGSQAYRPTWYPNKRSELWFETVERARADELDLTRLSSESLNKLRVQAMVVEWDLLQGKRTVEQKHITRKKLGGDQDGKNGRSPDGMDALNLAFYAGGTFEAPPVIEGPPARPLLHERVFGRNQ